MQGSVLTLVRGRDGHLRNLMRSLQAQTVRPLELIIAYMQDAPVHDLPDPGCPVREIIVDGEPMPLARARNAAAAAAAGEVLIFLDVDCIASPGLTGAYLDAASAARGLFLGEVLYLPGGAVGDALDYGRLDRLGQRHPAKPDMPATGLRAEEDSGELWGLSFALAASEWAALGGMDEAFTGYGAEETDFAARVGAAGLPVYWTAGARAYHQHHPVHIPPLHHFDHILRNAALYRERHGRWCMDYWLGQFAQAGLIDWSLDAEAIGVRRRPTADEVAAARQPDHILYS
ncbi:glycosyltransferase family 2 protein [Aureimonas frigidaquae]|uniref:Sugar transferase n=1 Tax=Aureimonas frigidaquae TaxID=424757 RepID=A0A0P0Z4R2_9HYPH|nr:galactosyltransferase-related protein [Aureimonas frigidaquae]BAT28822.1 sugar transferase [Aureimonas frigidaquae]